MKKYFFPAVLLIILAVLAFIANGKRKEVSVEAFNVNVLTEDDIKNELITAIFIESITNYVEDFYSEFYSGQIAVYNYETIILEISKTNNGYITIEFGVTPQIGAHNPLGYDELLYLVDSTGNGKMAKYEHKKNYTIPERFEEYIIKPIE